MGFVTCTICDGLLLFPCCLGFAFLHFVYSCVAGPLWKFHIFVYFPFCLFWAILSCTWLLAYPYYNEMCVLLFLQCSAVHTLTHFSSYLSFSFLVYLMVFCCCLLPSATYILFTISIVLNLLFILCTVPLHLTLLPLSLAINMPFFTSLSLPKCLSQVPQQEHCMFFFFLSFSSYAYFFVFFF